MATPAVDDKAVVEDGAVREQDKFLPIANISRIMKEGLPHNAKISKDAKELVQQCVSDFIIFVTSECVSISVDLPVNPSCWSQACDATSVLPPCTAGQVTSAKEKNERLSTAMTCSGL